MQFGLTISLNCSRDVIGVTTVIVESEEGKYVDKGHIRSYPPDIWREPALTLKLCDGGYCIDKNRLFRKLARDLFERNLITNNCYVLHAGLPLNIKY